ncbi:GDP/GTP exchange factor for ARF [Massospora cicadina]|nr:GDP/GTP exchange factor for ARF [Massospora cicadina]
METEVEPSIASSYESYLEIRQGIPTSPVASNSGQEPTGELAEGEPTVGGVISSIPDMVAEINRADVTNPTVGSPRIVDGKDPLIGSPELRRRACSEASELELCPGWKLVVVSCIDRLIDRMLLNPNHQPNACTVHQAFTTILQGSYSFQPGIPPKTEANMDNPAIRNKDGTEPGPAYSYPKYSSPSNVFGKLGQKINTQVFEFERWDQFESVKPVQLGDALGRLARLRQEILDVVGHQGLDAGRLVEPFIRVLDSGVASGPIVSAAFAALQEFVALRLINPNLRSFNGAINRVSAGLANCRFLSGDPEADELALLHLIKAIGTFIGTPELLVHMTPAQVESLMRSALAVSCQSRISKAASSQAEAALSQMALKLFKCLKSSQRELLGRILESFISLLEPHAKHTANMQLLGLDLTYNLIADMGRELFEVEAFARIISGKLCRLLWTLLDGDEVELVAGALQQAKLLIFTHPAQLKQQQLLWIQLATRRLTELSTPTLSSGHFMPHRSERLTFLFTDFLLGLIRTQPALFSELYVNYDCVANQPDLAAEVLSFLMESSLSHTKAQGSQAYRPNLWMDQILLLLTGMFNRGQCQVWGHPLAQLTDLGELANWCARPAEVKRGHYCTRSAAELRNAQRHKKAVREGVALFNRQPQDGIRHLIRCQLLPPRDSLDFCAQLSHLLHTTLGIDKRGLGEFLSKADNAPILEAFIAKFDFANKRLDVAMREFLASFRLPGESQLISRIFERFSERYFATRPDYLHDVDSVYLLAYSIIMINTDLHNPHVKRKIQFSTFQSMHTGSNGGQGIDKDFLRAIYDAIAEDEIVLPDEQVGAVSRDYTWKLYTGPAFEGGYHRCRPGQYDRELLLSVHRPLVDFFIQTFSEAVSDYALQVALLGLQLALQVGDHHGLSDVVDYALRRARELAGSIFGSPSDGAAAPVRNRTQQVDGTVLSDLSLSLGQSYKAQLMTVFLMAAAGHAPCSIFDAWWDILDVLRLVADSYLLPPSLVEVPQLTLPAPSPAAAAPIPFRPTLGRPATRAQEVVTSDSGNRIFATFSSLLGYPSQSPALIWDVSPQILFSCLDSVRKLVPACQFADVFGSLPRLDSASFEAVLKRVMILVKGQHAVADESPASASPKPTATYRPSTAVFIRWIVQANGNRADAGQHWPLIISFLGDVCYHADYYDPYLVQLAVTELMLLLYRALGPDQQVPSAQRLSNPLQSHARSRCSMILGHLGSLSPAVVGMACEPLLAGFKLLHEADPSIFSQMAYWTSCLHLLQAALGQGDAAITQAAFPLVQRLAETLHFVPLGHVDYLALVNLLIEFCNPDRFIHSSEDAVDPVVSRSLLAIQYLAGLLPKVPLLASGNSTPKCAQLPSSLSSAPNARSFYYLPPLIGLSSLFAHQRRDVRHRAYQLLLRNITSPGLLAAGDPTPEDWVPIFSRVLFPLLEKMAGPLAAPLQDARTCSISLSSATFLQFVTSAVSASPYQEGPYGVFSELWLQYLDRLLQLVRVPDSQGVPVEAALETLKNVVLVLMSTSLLSPPEVSAQHKSIEHTSSCTWERIGAKLPALINQLFPPPPRGWPRTTRPQSHLPHPPLPDRIPPAIPRSCLRVPHRQPPPRRDRVGRLACQIRRRNERGAPVAT